MTASISVSLIPPGPFDESVRAVGWTLVHSVWLLLLISQVYLICDRLLARSGAKVRYAVGVATLLLMAAAPLVTLHVLLQRPAQGMELGVDAVSMRLSNRIPELPDHSSAADAGTGVARRVTTVDDLHAAAATSLGDAPALEVWRDWSAKVESRVEPWLMTLVVLWAMGVVVLLMRPCLGLRAARRMRRLGIATVPAHVAEVTRELCRRLGLRPINVNASSLVTQPIVVGWLRPVILLPGCMVTKLPVDQLQAVLAHELAHIRRHDWLVNALQLLVETLLFYHPAVWCVSRRIREERENCCDDLAIKIIGSRQVYARMLLGIEQLRQTVSPPALAANGGSLPARIRRIARPDADAVLRRSWIAVATGVVAMGIAVACGTGLFLIVESTPGHAHETPSAPGTKEDLSADDAPPPSRGILRGRILYDGTPPEPATLNFEARHRALYIADVPNSPDQAEFFADGIPDESLLVGPEGGLRNVVVWVFGGEIARVAERRTDEPVRIRAQKGRFVPHVSVFEAHRSIELENEDPYVYDFHVWPRVGYGWNTVVVPVGGIIGSRGGQYVQTEPVTVVRPLRPQPQPIRLSNDIYSWFEGWLLPLGHPFYAVTDEEGRFEIPDLPPGEWTFAFWHERGGWLDAGRISDGKLTLRIAMGVNDLGDVRVDPAAFDTGEAEESLDLRVPQAPAPIRASQAGSSRADSSYNGDGFAPLHIAAKAGNVDTVTELLDRGEDVDVRHEEYGGTPLQYAATQGRDQVVALLLRHDATVDAVDWQLRTPLMWAAQKGNLEAARLLIEGGADVNRQMQGGWSPLHYAVRDGYAELAQLLVDAGADLTLRTGQGKTAADLNPGMELMIPEGNTSIR